VCREVQLLRLIRWGITVPMNHQHARQGALKAAASGKPADRVIEPGAKEPLYLAACSLHVSCGLSYIATEADLDKWLAALRATAAKELAKGNRISL